MRGHTRAVLERGDPSGITGAAHEVTLEKDEWRCDCWSPGSCPKCVLRCLNKYSIIFWGRLTPEAWFKTATFLWHTKLHLRNYQCYFFSPITWALEPLVHISRSEDIDTCYLLGREVTNFLMYFRIYMCYYVFSSICIKEFYKNNKGNHVRARRHDLNYPSLLENKGTRKSPPLVHFMCQTWLGHKVAWH